MLSSSHADSRHLSASVRQGLSEVSRDLEDILQHLGDAADEQTAGIKEKANRALSSLRDIEHQTEERLRVASRETQRFVHEKPWAVIATATLAAYVMGFLTRPRH